MYRFLHDDFEGVEYCATRQYVSLPKEVREEDFFVSDAQEDGNEVLPVSELHFFVEQRVYDVEIWDLPCLASGHNLNLTSEEMADLWRQGIAVDDNNDPAPENIPDP